MSKASVVDRSGPLARKIANDLSLQGMASAYRRQCEAPDIYTAMSFEERMDDLCNAQITYANQARFEGQLKRARLMGQGLPFDGLEFSEARGLSRQTASQLMTMEWLREGHITNLLVMGPSGAGKTEILCALARECIRQGFSARYFKAMTFLEDLDAMDLPQRKRFVRTISKINVLVLDDIATVVCSDSVTTKFYELLDARMNTGATMMGSQVNVEGIAKCFRTSHVEEGLVRRLFGNCVRITLGKRGEDIK